MKQERQKRVIKKMEEQGLKQIIVTSTASIFYLTGLWIEPHERMIALYLDTEGRTALFGNEIFGIEHSEGMDFFIHTDNDNPIQELAQYVKPGKIGIDKFWPSRFLIGLLEANRDLNPVVGSAPVDHARMLKDEEEQKAMRQASRINDQVVTGAISAIREGIRENELASLVNKLFLENGADCEGTQLVCFGANGADPHHGADATVIRRGDSVIFDIFTPIHRYWCDMTRTVFFDEVQEEQRRVYELVKKANLAAEQAVRPGIPLKELDQIARKIIENGGYGNYFTHRLGHNIGLDCHEPPDVSGVSEAVAQPGMVFSIEPGIYLPGRFGVRIEDLVLVTENGCEVLNRASKDLNIVK